MDNNHILGWIKLYRSIRNHWIWNDPDKLKWWLDILLEVNHSNKKVNIGYDLIECKRGQSIMSLQNWSERWNITKSKTKRFFDLLAKDKMIITENLIKTTRITVCNYDNYNSERNASETQVKRKRNASETQAKTNKNDKNIKNEKNYIYKLKNFNLSITEDEYNKLLTDYTEEDIKDIFDAIDNDKKTKNKNSLYLTSLNWLKRNNLKKQKFIKHKSFYRNQYKLKVNNNQKKSHEIYKQIITIIVNKKDALKKTPLSFKDFAELKQYADNQNINLLRNINDIIASDEIVYKLDLATGIRTYINNNSKSL